MSRFLVARYRELKQELHRVTDGVNEHIDNLNANFKEIDKKIEAIEIELNNQNSRINLNFIKINDNYINLDHVIQIELIENKVQMYILHRRDDCIEYTLESAGEAKAFFDDLVNYQILRKRDKKES